MAWPRRMQKVAAAWAQVAKAQKKTVLDDEEISSKQEESDIDCTSWTGGIGHVLSDSKDDEAWEDTDDSDSTEDFESDTDSDEDFELEELEGQDLVEQLRKCWEL